MISDKQDALHDTLDKIQLQCSWNLRYWGIIIYNMRYLGVFVSYLYYGV